MALTSERTYDRSHGVVFFKTREAFGELSNMSSRYALNVAGSTVPSSEALYQACRFPHLPEIQERIISQKSPMTAKMVSKPYRSQSRSDWEDIRVPVMKWCLKVKLVQHWSEFGGVLLKTGDLPIIEQSTKDPFWGAIPDRDGHHLKGANVLGRLLMELRDILRKKPTRLNVIEPVQIPDFLLVGREIEPISKLRLVHSVKPAATLDLLQVSAVKSQKAANPKPASAPRILRQKMQSATLELPIVKPLPPEKRAAKDVQYHVVSSRRGGWDILRDGAKRVSAHFDTKLAAIERGRQLAHKHKIKLVIHDRAGRIVS